MVCAGGDVCDPENFYVIRHSERYYAAGGNGANDAQEILTPEGFVRARELRNKFVNVRLFVCVCVCMYVCVCMCVCRQHFFHFFVTVCG